MARAILLRDRASAIYQLSGLGAAQRIAAIVKVLDRVDPATRATLLPALNNPQLHVTLNAAPLAVEGGEDMHARHLRSMLADMLGDKRPVQVAPMFGRGPHEHHSSGHRHPMLGPMAAYFPSHGVAFEIYTPLADGAWVRFEHGLRWRAVCVAVASAAHARRVIAFGDLGGALAHTPAGRAGKRRQ